MGGNGSFGALVLFGILYSLWYSYEDSLLWLICFFLFTRTTPESGFTLLPPSQEEIDYIAKNLNQFVLTL